MLERNLAGRGSIGQTGRDVSRIRTGARLSRLALAEARLVKNDSELEAGDNFDEGVCF
jgi:hypothetical protein